MVDTRKTNFFVKYLNNISKLINSLLEKNLNKINFENLSYLFKNNKIIKTTNDKTNLLLFVILCKLSKFNLLKFFFISLFNAKFVLFINLTKLL